MLHLIRFTNNDILASFFLVLLLIRGRVVYYLALISNASRAFPCHYRIDAGRAPSQRRARSRLDAGNSRLGTKSETLAIIASLDN